MIGRTAGRALLALAAMAIGLTASRADAQVRTYAGGVDTYGMAAPAPYTYMPYTANYSGAAPFGVYAANGGRVFYGYGQDNWNGFAVNNMVWGDNRGVNWGSGFVNPYVGAYGQSPYSLLITPASQFQAQANRYNFLAADSLADYQATLLYQQRTAAANLGGPHLEVVQPGRGGTSTLPAGQEHIRVMVSSLVPREKLVDEHGNVRWPAAAPSDAKAAPARQAAQAAIKTAFDEAKKRREASPQSVEKARRDLADYLRPALDRLRNDNPADAVALEVFSQSLDQTLLSLTPPATTRPGYFQAPRSRPAASSRSSARP